LNVKDQNIFLRSSGVTFSSVFNFFHNGTFP
jgi:hypothetical protein